MVIVDVFGAVIYLAALCTVFVKNKKDLTRVVFYRMSILADFFLFFMTEIFIYGATALGVFASMELCPSHALRMAIKINTNLDLILIQLHRFLSFYRPLLYRDSSTLAIIQIIIAKLAAFLLTLVSTFLSPSLISCSSCMLCMSTRPVMVYLTSSLCIITAIISTTITIYTFIVLRRQRTVFHPPVSFLTFPSAGLTTAESLKKQRNRKTAKSLILLNLTTLFLLVWISGEVAAIMNLGCESQSCSSYLSAMKYLQIIRIFTVFLHPVILIAHTCTHKI